MPSSVRQNVKRISLEELFGKYVLLSLKTTITITNQIFKKKNNNNLD